MPLGHKIGGESDGANCREDAYHCHQPPWLGVDRLRLIESNALTQAAGDVTRADLQGHDAVHSRGGVVLHRVSILASGRETSGNLHTALLVILHAEWNVNKGGTWLVRAI